MSLKGSSEGLGSVVEVEREEREVREGGREGGRRVDDRVGYPPRVDV